MLLGTGCDTVHQYSLTYRLWDDEDLRKWSEPATDPKLELYALPERKDVVVRYGAFSEKHSLIRRHA